MPHPASIVLIGGEFTLPKIEESSEIQELSLHNASVKEQEEAQPLIHMLRLYPSSQKPLSQHPSSIWLYIKNPSEQNLRSLNIPQIQENSSKNLILRDDFSEIKEIPQLAQIQSLCVISETLPSLENLTDIQNLGLLSPVTSLPNLSHMSQLKNLIINIDSLYDAQEEVFNLLPPSLKHLYLISTNADHINNSALDQRNDLPQNLLEQIKTLLLNGNIQSVTIRKPKIESYILYDKWNVTRINNHSVAHDNLPDNFSELLPYKLL